MKPLKISLKAARINANLTQADVANRLGKTKQTLINWELGKNKIDKANLRLLADIYKIPVDNIFLP